MYKLFKVVGVAGLILGLAGCKEDQYDYQYLVTHPVVMKKKLEACEKLSKTASNMEKQRCQIVVNASTKFMSVVAEQLLDAEKFGVRVLTAEMDDAKAQAEVVRIKTDIEKLKASTPIDMAALHKLQEDLAAAKKVCKEKRQEVKMLLAVIGVSAPN